MQEIRDRLRQFIIEKYLPGESPANLSDETRLLSSGILDSLASLELVAFVEREFDIEVTAFERGLETLDRIADLSSLIARKRLRKAS